MKGTVKIKLPFEPGIKTEERVKKLIEWARGIHRGKNVTVLETQHFTNMSFIVIKNPFFRSNF